MTQSSRKGRLSQQDVKCFGGLAPTFSAGVETTLAGSWTTTAIQAAHEEAFFVRLYYICVDNPDAALSEFASEQPEAAIMFPMRTYGAGMREASQMPRK